MANLDKFAIQHVYWSSFGMPAYHELTVPEDAKMPYLTYQTASGQLGGVSNVSASVYYKGTSWASIMQEVSQMEKFIDRQLFFDGGIIKIRKPLANFAQPMSESGDPKVRRIVLTVEIEFLSM